MNLLNNPFRLQILRKTKKAIIGLTCVLLILFLLAYNKLPKRGNVTSSVVCKGKLTQVKPESFCQVSGQKKEIMIAILDSFSKRIRSLKVSFRYTQRALYIRTRLLWVGSLFKLNETKNT